MSAARLPPPLVLETSHQKIGLRVQEMFDSRMVRRLAVVLTVDGTDWAPFYCGSPVEAAQQVHALFSVLDRFGPWGGGAAGADEGAGDPEDERQEWDAGAVGLPKVADERWERLLTCMRESAWEEVDGAAGRRRMMGSGRDYVWDRSMGIWHLA